MTMGRSYHHLARCVSGQGLSTSMSPPGRRPNASGRSCPLSCRRLRGDQGGLLGQQMGSKRPVAGSARSGEHRDASWGQRARHNRFYVPFCHNPSARTPLASYRADLLVGFHTAEVAGSKPATSTSHTHQHNRAGQAGSSDPPAWQQPLAHPDRPRRHQPHRRPGHPARLADWVRGHWGIEALLRPRRHPHPTNARHHQPVNQTLPDYAEALHHPPTTSA